MYTMPYHVETLYGMRIGINGGAIKVACYVCKIEVITIPDVKGLVAAVVGSQSWCPLRPRQRNQSRGSAPQDVPPLPLATVLRNQSHVQQGDHHKKKSAVRALVSFT